MGRRFICCFGLQLSLNDHTLSAVNIPHCPDDSDELNAIVPATIGDAVHACVRH